MILPAPRTFQPKLDMLPASQRRLWPELSDTPAPFVLYGGTAIALRLGHRVSVDFDFFSHQPFDPRTLADAVPYLADADIYQVAPNTLGCRVDRGGTVQLSFLAPRTHPRLQPAERAADTGLPVASLRDLAVAKLTAVQGRAEAKDYLDLHALIHQAGLRLDDMLLDAHAVYGRRFAPLASLQALTYYEEGDLPALTPMIRADLTRLAREIDLDRIERRIEDQERHAAPEQEP